MDFSAIMGMFGGGGGGGGGNNPFGGGGGSADGWRRFGSALGLGGSSNRAVKRMGKGYLDARKAVLDRFTPYAETGGRANSLVGSLLGTGEPGDTSGAEGLNRFRESSGYQDTLNSAMGGVASNAAARGLLGSSGTGRVFQDNASQLAQGSFGNYLSNLMNQQSMGMNASGAQSDLDMAEGNFMNENILGHAETMAQKKNASFLGKLFGG